MGNNFLKSIKHFFYSIGFVLLVEARYRYQHMIDDNKQKEETKKNELLGNSND